MPCTVAMRKKCEVMSKHFSDLRRQTPPLGRLPRPNDGHKIGPLAGNDPRGKTIEHFAFAFLRYFRRGQALAGAGCWSVAVLCCV